ncbi:hypothetical protein I203_104244 [Kwoniella mangroviensis CBS 8507]|uniref:uncharacterized protein n=1 Tax=Kwoniella mangroviensis CBS 8507 TaxID=1296122 RepID=UPI00080CC35D|nr:uncharacterized protein I203_00810 [Kwoniella mangroviensis CBS 8507]OCF70675.1 hypothetical protein I203_00810 [Kwoniella mangroviensis CBS 8507]
MPDDLSFLDQLEEWLDNQVPNNLHDLPYKMLETMEKVTNELFETLNIHGPPSISIPFPPFGGKDSPPPPPPPSPPSIIPTTGLKAAYCKSERLIKEHPYLFSAAISVGLGLTGLTIYKYSNNLRNLKNDLKMRRKFGVKGRVEDGMLKEAIVILAPSPMPPLLIPLAASLLRAGYIVLVAVPKSRDADQLERRLSGLEEKSALRVLIYDPDDTTTFPPFHRSLLATLTLRFPVSGKYPSGDPYNPSPEQLPHIHSFLSLYPLNPSPPSQPGSLPALPTLLSPNSDGSTPTLINFFPSGSVVTTPDTFASQVLTLNHHLLGRNLAASSGARIVSVYVGDVDLPTLPAILSGGKHLTRRQAAREQLVNNHSASGKISVIRDYLVGSISNLYGNILGIVGLGNKVKSYDKFEKKLLKIIKRPSYFNPNVSVLRGTVFRNNESCFIGSKSFFPFFVNHLNLPPILLSKLVGLTSTYVLPTSSTGPVNPVTTSNLLSPSLRHKEEKGLPRTPTTASANSSDHEGNDDLISSIHTTSNSSGNGDEDTSASGSGMEGSWVGLDSAN